jgi:DNA polymerase/3'-5' exonuclease PolX
MTEKVRYPAKAARAVAEQLVELLRPACVPNLIEIAGSLRRRRPTVGDVEIVYVSAIGRYRADLFRDEGFYLADVVIADMERLGILKRRLNKKQQETFGELNKLMIHVDTGIPVDLFAAKEPAWWNYLVCRTGGASSNARLAARARELGLMWNPYEVGFTRSSDDEVIPVTCEADVWRILGLKYQEPWERP